MVTYWFLIGALFVQDVPVNGRMWPVESEAECRKEAENLKQQAAEKGVDLWVQCVKAEMKKKPKPTTNEDGTSPDGKRRGSGA